MSIPPAWPQVLDFFGTPLVIEPSVGHPCTWRSLLIKVAAEVVVRTWRIVVRLSSSWPDLDWYRRVCERLRAPLPIPVPEPSG
jgi:hypothetical protein